MRALLRNRLTLCLCVLLAAGCDDDEPTTPDPVTVTGVYQGTINVGGFPGASVSISQTQTGSTVDGTWISSSGRSGTLTGSVSGSTESFTMTQVNPCAGTITGSASIQASGAALSGTFTGTDCSGAVAGTFTVNRQ